MEQEAVYESKMNKTGIESNTLLGTKRVEVILELEPMGAVRSTANDKHTDRVKMYHAYKKKLQWLWVDAMLKAGLSSSYTLPGHIEYIEFGLSIENPFIGSKKQQQERLDMVGKPHLIKDKEDKTGETLKGKKPDIDNLFKALTDSICYKKDDSHIHSLGGMRKVYAPYDKGYIKVVFYI